MLIKLYNKEEFNKILGSHYMFKLTSLTVQHVS